MPGESDLRVGRERDFAQIKIIARDENLPAVVAENNASAVINDVVIAAARRSVILSGFLHRREAKILKREDAPIDCYRIGNVPVRRHLESAGVDIDGAVIVAHAAVHEERAFADLVDDVVVVPGSF